MKNDRLRLVRELRGAPLSIIVVLAMVREPCRQEYLERTTGYTDKPVSQALAYMRDIGLVVNIPSVGWALTEQARMIPGLDVMLPEPETETAAIVEQEAVTEDEMSRNISDSLVVKLRESESIKDNSINLLSDSLVLSAEDPEFLRLVQKLRACGVYLRTAQELAVSHGQAIDEKILYYRHALGHKLAQGPGWLVQAIKEDWGEPLGWKSNGNGRCSCERCAPAREAESYGGWDE